MPRLNMPMEGGSGRGSFETAKNGAIGARGGRVASNSNSLVAKLQQLGNRKTIGSSPSGDMSNQEAQHRSNSIPTASGVGIGGGKGKLGRRWPPSAEDEAPEPPKDTSPAGIFGITLKNTGKLALEGGGAGSGGSTGGGGKKVGGGKVMEMIRKTEAVGPPGQEQM